jgi:hypothetical protein
VKCLTPFCLLIALSAFTCCTTIPAQRRPDVDGSVYEVIPSTWITASGHGVSSATQPSAYVFPSLNPDGSARDPDIYKEPDFFADGNHFRDKEDFSWQSEGGVVIKFGVARSSTPNRKGVSITVAPGSETAVRRLTWRQFDHLQISFHHWLCGKSVFWFWESCESRFPPPPQSGPDNLSKFWQRTVLGSADFKAFDPSSITSTTCYHCEVSYKLDLTPAPNDVNMYATLLSPGDALNIAWGLTVLYPQKSRGVSSGYSRSSVGGSTEINIAANSKGLNLFPKESWNSTPESEPDDQQTVTASTSGNNLVPFPTAFASMMVPAQFIPINNSLDLRDGRLLRASSGGLPPYLFVLSPKTYTKADAALYPNGKADPAGIAQFYSDAREVDGNLVDAPPNEAVLQFSRRFILVGCDTPEAACVTGQLKALQCQALALLNTPCSPTIRPPVYAMGIFANQTFLEVRHHVSINGRPLPATVLDQQTWDSVVAGWATSLLDQNGNPGSEPLLRVRRTIRSNTGVDRRMTILFYTTSSQALGATQVFEGDEFYAKSDL